MTIDDREMCVRPAVLLDPFVRLTHAALDPAPVCGWTHDFYRYPARFSPTFARAAIEQFSSPGDLIADPYMGGGTTVVEGIVAGRHVLGNDLNALAVFITRVKTSSLSAPDASAVRVWAERTVPMLSYATPGDQVAPFIDHAKTKNLSSYRARFLKKTIAAALATIADLPKGNAQRFAQCALLRVGQWALDGKKKPTSPSEFRSRLTRLTVEMLSSISRLSRTARRSGGRVTLLNRDAASLDQTAFFRHSNQRVSLVVTSPPYPGVHVLYHRWQVDGRRETPAPYWISSCDDGQGASFYNFGHRRQANADRYFDMSLRTLCGIRNVLRDGAHVVQMVAFSRPEEQLPRYLHNMYLAGFSEVSWAGKERIWRQVPNRKWHATFLGGTNAAREVVLVHRAE